MSARYCRAPVSRRIDVTEVMAHDCDSANAQSAMALHDAALEKRPEASETRIMSDNAKYYRNKELRERVKGTKIIPLFLSLFAKLESRGFPRPASAAASRGQSVPDRRTKEPVFKSQKAFCPFALMS